MNTHTTVFSTASEFRHSVGKSEVGLYSAFELLGFFRGSSVIGPHKNSVGKINGKNTVFCKTVNNVAIKSRANN